MLAVTKVKMRGSEKRADIKNRYDIFFHETCNEDVSGSFPL